MIDWEAFFEGQCHDAAEEARLEIAEALEAQRRAAEEARRAAARQATAEALLEAQRHATAEEAAATQEDSDYDDL